MVVAIDLTWVKVNCSGGTEFYTRNILDGLCSLNDENQYYLICAVDNADSFKHYLKDKRFHIKVCNINSKSVIKRIIWYNFRFNKVLKNNGINNCFVPIYFKPLVNDKKMNYIIVIHDLQFFHYPKNFSYAKRVWYRYSINKGIKSSKAIIADCDWVKEDTINIYGKRINDIETIYVPICISKTNNDFEYISNKYGLKKDEFFFILSSLLEHKNVITVLKTFNKIIKENIDVPHKLVIAGIAQMEDNSVVRYINDNNLNGYCYFLGKVSDRERNALYSNCYAFLFPSVFEGFGMPPVEAMIMGCRVITTKRASLYEVTQGKAVYVDDPYDEDVWIDKMKAVGKIEKKSYEFPEYDKTTVAKKLLKLFEKHFT